MMPEAVAVAASSRVAVWPGIPGRADRAIAIVWGVTVLVVAVAGVVLRAAHLGTWGLSTDEAWIGIVARVHGFEQFRLAIAMTPVAWATLVKLVSGAFGHSEIVLRAVPFGFGCLTMGAALTAGTRFGGRVGGLLALAAVAFDPLEIDYARVLKQYAAEAFLCIIAIDRAAVYATMRTRGALASLAVVLALGLVFANSQLALAPPVFAALVVDTILARDRRAVRDLALAAALVMRRPRSRRSRNQSPSTAFGGLYDIIGVFQTFSDSCS